MQYAVVRTLLYGSPQRALRIRSSAILAVRRRIACARQNTEGPLDGMVVEQRVVHVRLKRKLIRECLVGRAKGF